MFSKFLKKKFGKKKTDETAAEGAEAAGEEKPEAVGATEAGSTGAAAADPPAAASASTGALNTEGAAASTADAPAAVPVTVDNASPLLQLAPPMMPLLNPLMPQLLPPPAGMLPGLGFPQMNAFAMPGGYPLMQVMPTLDSHMQPPHVDVHNLSRSNSTVGVPPKSIPDSQNLLGSTTRSQSPGGKSQGGKKMVKKKPPHPNKKASSPPSANQSMIEASLSTTNEAIVLNEEEAEEVVPEAEAKSHTEKPAEAPVVAPVTPAVSTAVETPASVELSPSTPVPTSATLVQPAALAFTPVVAALTPSIVQVPQPQPVAVKVAPAPPSDDDDDDAPRFAEVTDVPTRNPNPRAQSVASSDSDGPIMEEVATPPKKPIHVAKAVQSPKTPISPPKHVASPGSAPPPQRSATVTPTKPVAPLEEDLPEQLHSEVITTPPPEPSINAADRRVSRRLAADRFVSIFSQSQHFGEVKGLKRVTIFDDNIEEELSTNFVVAQRPQLSSQLYFDNVQLCPDDITPDCVVTDDGCIETIMEMYSIRDGGRHAYVEKEREAAKLFSSSAPKSYPPVTCVYVTEKQALVCKEGCAKRLASLVVVWRPTSCTTKEDECPVHHKLKELYDPATRGLACALCSAGEGRKMLVLSEIVSPSLQSEVIKVVEGKRAAIVTATRKQIAAQQRMQRARDRSLQVVNEQFDALLAVIEAKRREFVDEVEGRLRAEMDEVEAGIEGMVDVTRLLDAARAGLKASNPLAPPQMATIATAIKTKVPTPSDVVPQIGRVFINLADISHKVQRIPVEVDGGTPVTGTPVKGQSPRRRHRSESEDEGAAPTPTGRSRSQRLKATVATKAPPSTGLQACKPGTSLFNFPLHEMPRDRDLEWRLRIDDAGDWLGVGVGVGGQLEEWARGGIFDLHHLWVVPPSAPRTIVVRVSPIPNGNMKLSIHKANGQQIDDGRIPHWHCSRTSFPQVSFAGRQGKVTMLTVPN